MSGARSVFIVDDAALMRLTISNLLRSGGFEVAGAAENGQKALMMLRGLKPDIILLDIEMPVMDGLEFLRHVRLKTRSKIVVLSSVAGAGSEKAQRARQLGADAVLQKPSGSVSTDLAAKSGKLILDTLRRLAP